MKTLIVYATKSGATRECAELISTKIKDCTLCDIAKQIPAIKNYDIVILGSGVRMGKIYKPLKNFIEQNMDTLLTKKTVFFFCNSYPNTFQKIIEKNMPEQLLNNTLYLDSLGGIPPFTSPKNKDWVLYDHLNQLVQSVNAKE
ncbi:flavodoxin domain-containing protein [Scatolibacter rhodanostii]|uniref:flavodoxin domain-containing protein n=1 Tax=Scatolibacter rhodanostii TaxID=2014781 RepID=UPI000C08506F|nr:flavodoxin domain-containing protein [Scatolibacter rhodanostii]